MNRKSDACLVERSHFETRGSESRKVRKPLMEKKRRARINQSLNDLKRLLMETGSVKKEGSRPSKLEKADVLELTVNYVQKLHKERLVLRGSSLSKHHTGGFGIYPSQSGESSTFKAGFKECARVVRQVLSHQPQQTIEENLHSRVGWHLEKCLAKIELEQIQRKSPSLSLRSDSCSSFEEKDMLTCSHEFISQRSSPVNYAMCSSSSSEESQDSCTRQSFSSKRNDFELTSTPNASPVDVFKTNLAESRFTCGFKLVPYGSPDSMADKWSQSSDNHVRRHQITPSLLQYENKGNATDVHNIDLWTSDFHATSTSPSDSSSSSLATFPTQHHYAPECGYRHRTNQFDDHISLSLSIPESEKSNVWRPW